MEHVVGCWRCSGGLWTSALPRTWTRYSESLYKIRIHISTICRYLHAPEPRGLGYSLLVLEHRAMSKNYGERKRFLDAMAT